MCRWGSLPWCGMHGNGPTAIAARSRTYLAAAVPWVPTRPRVAKPLMVGPRLLLHVGLGLRRLAPFAERMEVDLPVWSAVNDRVDVVACPGVARAEGASAAENRTAPPVIALEDPEPHAGRHRGVVGQADHLGRSPRRQHLRTGEIGNSGRFDIARLLLDIAPAMMIRKAESN
jgi:hypothetical protein